MQILRHRLGCTEIKQGIFITAFIVCNASTGKAGKHIRLGGDEFCIIMPETSQSQGEVIREKILEINRRLEAGVNGLPPFTLAAGIAFWDRPNPRGNLFKDADSTLLELKRNRNSLCEIYPIHSEAGEPET